MELESYCYRANGLCVSLLDGLTDILRILEVNTHFQIIHLQFSRFTFFNPKEFDFFMWV